MYSRYSEISTYGTYSKLLEILKNKERELATEKELFRKI